MKKNLSLADRIIRVLIALVIAILYLTHYLSGTTAIVLGSVAVILAATSMIGTCPLYAIFRISTNKKK